MLEVKYYSCAQINVPEWYKDRQFRRWLAETAATWHRGQEPPGEYADAFVWYDGGEGSDSPLNFSPDAFPEKFWHQLVATLGKDWHGVVWLTNLEE